MKKLLPYLLAVFVFAVIAIGIYVVGGNGQESDSTFEGATMVMNEAEQASHENRL